MLALNLSFFSSLLFIVVRGASTWLPPRHDRCSATAKPSPTGVPRQRIPRTFPSRESPLAFPTGRSHTRPSLDRPLRNPVLVRVWFSRSMCGCIGAVSEFETGLLALISAAAAAAKISACVPFQGCRVNGCVKSPAVLVSSLPCSVAAS